MCSRHQPTLQIKFLHEFFLYSIFDSVKIFYVYVCRYFVEIGLNASQIFTSILYIFLRTFSSSSIISKSSFVSVLSLIPAAAASIDMTLSHFLCDNVAHSVQ